MLIKSEVFYDNEGFESVKADMFDDVGFARALKAKKYHVGYWFAPEFLRVRLFKNNSDAFWGNTKNILGAVEGNVVFALPLILLAIFQYWTPLFAIIFGYVTVNPYILFIGLSTYTIQYFSFFSVRKILSFQPLKLLFFPLVVIVATCCILRAVYYQKKGKIFWRGRAIKVK